MTTLTEENYGNCKFCGELADRLCAKCQSPCCSNCDKSDWEDQENTCIECKECKEYEKEKYNYEFWTDIDKRFQKIKNFKFKVNDNIKLSEQATIKINGLMKYIAIAEYYAEDGFDLSEAVFDGITGCDYFGKWRKKNILQDRQKTLLKNIDRIEANINFLLEKNIIICQKTP